MINALSAVDWTAGVPGMPPGRLTPMQPGPHPAEQVDGSSRDDTLYGTANDDTLRGQAGADWLQGMAGNDRLEGGAGNDVAAYGDAVSGVNANLATGRATGGSGTDTLLSIENLWGSLQDDTLTGDHGDNLLFGSFGNDRIVGGLGNDLLFGGDGDDTLVGGAGNDFASYMLSFAGVTVDLQAGYATDEGGRDQLFGIEAAIGSFYDDTLTGDAGSNFFVGSEGNDQIDGGGGDEDHAAWDASLALSTIRYDTATGWLSVSTPYDGTDRVREVEFLHFGDDSFPIALFMPGAVPVPLDFSPDNAAQDVRISSDLTMTFNKPVQPGHGTIVLRDARGVVAATFDVATSPDLLFDGSTLSIDPPALLKRSTIYTLELPAGAVVDADGQGNAAFSSYRFTTRSDLEVSIAGTTHAPEGGVMQVEVQLSEASAQPVWVTLLVVDDGTAGDGSDVATQTRTVEFAPGQTTATVPIALPDDDRFEPTESFGLRLSDPAGAVIGNATGRGLIVDNDTATSPLPDDPLVGQEWHLFPGIGVNVLGVWPEYTGAGVRVGVFDQGIDPAHPDLDGRIDRDLGVIARTLGPGGQPLTGSDNHGTAVAGVIAAARNGVGTVGVAYGADLVSLYQPFSDDSTLSEIENAFRYAQALDVLNNSWGFAPQYYLDAPWAFYDNFADPAFAAIGDALKALAEQGRGGLGTVVVQSAGNSFEFGDDTNLHSFQNSRYIITVAATDYNGSAAHYSSPGASVLVAAPGGDAGGGEILTTDRSGRPGYAAGDHVDIAGTSFSAPVVSGVVALMLEANPQLGYRDVQRILAATAQRSAEEDNDWRSNGATGWNGGGLHYDAQEHDLGFGLVNAWAAVRLAETWSGPASTAANVVVVQAARATPAAIPDGAQAVTQTLWIGESIEVERVEVTVDIQHGFIGDLSLQLVSPAGTESWILSRPGQNALSAFGADQADLRFTFSTVLSLGESSRGDWSLSVYDEALGDIGSLQSWSLNLIGRAPSDDDTYLYTDEYAQAVAETPGRGQLDDAGGSDTLNAAAVSSASVIDLTPGGSASRLAGQPLVITSETVIESAYGGDGDDRLIGNSADNRLYGMRGNDLLQGGMGDDRLDGGAGIDTVRSAGQRADHRLERGSEGWQLAGEGGDDALIGVERLVFDDLSLALDTTAHGHAGQAAQVLRALFGPASLARADYVGIGLSLLDSGTPVADVVALVLQSPVFLQAAGSGSHADIVRLVYTNVVGSAPDAQELAYYAGLLDDGSITPEALALLACQSPLNATSVELVGLLDSGLAYVPYEPAAG